MPDQEVLILVVCDLIIEVFLLKFVLELGQLVKLWRKGSSFLDIFFKMLLILYIIILELKQKIVCIKFILAVYFMELFEIFFSPLQVKAFIFFFLLFIFCILKVIERWTYLNTSLRTFRFWLHVNYVGNWNSCAI